MKHTKTIIAAIVVCLGLATTAQAISIGADNLIGTVAPGDNNAAGETAELQYLIDRYNAGDTGVLISPPGHESDTYTLDVGAAVPGVPPGLPVAAVFGSKDEDDPFLPIVTDGALYMGLKLGGPKDANDPAVEQQTLYFWLGDLGGDTITEINWLSLGIDNPGRLSHVSLFNPGAVPDGGTTVALFGAALLGLGAMRRKLKA